MQQLITIMPDGKMVGLQFKKGRGLDLKGFGPAQIERSSLIEWDEDAQAWFVRLLKVGEDGLVLTWDYIATVFTRAEFFAKRQGWLLDGTFGDMNDEKDRLLFTEYDDAVRAEIDVIQTLRMAEGVNAV